MRGRWLQINGTWRLDEKQQQRAAPGEGLLGKGHGGRVGRSFELGVHGRTTRRPEEEGHGGGAGVLPARRSRGFKAAEVADRGTWRGGRAGSERGGGRGDRALSLASMCGGGTGTRGERWGSGESVAARLGL